MSKIIKQRWGIIETIDIHPFYLGQHILTEEYDFFNLYDNNDDTLDYVGKEKHLWKIVLKDNIVKEIYYKGNCPFPHLSLWDEHFDNISLYLSKKYKLLNEFEKFDGTVLLVVYRDFFVSIIGFIDSSNVGNG